MSTPTKIDMHRLTKQPNRMRQIPYTSSQSALKSLKNNNKKREEKKMKKIQNITMAGVTSAIMVGEI